MLINLNRQDTLSSKSPVFFGETLGVQRYDNVTYPEIERLTKKQLSFFWVPEEFGLVKDRVDFETLTDKEKHIFISNLKYQTLLDTIQGRGPSILKKAASYPEIESFIIAWEFFENIHSRSYTHIVKNLFPNPSEVFDSITTDENIIKRAMTTIESYERLESHIDANGSNLELVLDTLINVNILEGIRFYVSFICSFYFTEFKKVMEGNTKIIGSVQADEVLHLQFTQTLINLLNRDNSKFKEAFDNKQEEIYGMYRVAAEQEKEWADYLFKGYDDKMLDNIKNYIEYLVDIRLKAIKMKPIYNVTKNPLPWVNSYMNSKNVQDAPQETELNNYLVGSLCMDIDFDKLEQFSI